MLHTFFVCCHSLQFTNKEVVLQAGQVPATVNRKEVPEPGAAWAIGSQRKTWNSGSQNGVPGPIASVSHWS